MSDIKGAEGVGVDNTVVLIMLLIAGVPILFICFKFLSAPNQDDVAAGAKKGRKNRRKVEEASDPQDPVAWFAGKLSALGKANLAMLGKSEEEKYGMTPDEIWQIVDTNQDGVATMGEFKKGVSGSPELQHILHFDHVPDIKVVKKVFRTMQKKCSDGDGVDKATFLKFWDEIDTDQSGKVTQDEMDATMAKKGK
jgi:hypothetical protein